MVHIGILPSAYTTSLSTGCTLSLSILYVYIYISISIYVHIYIYIYTHTYLYNPNGKVEAVNEHSRVDLMTEQTVSKVMIHFFAKQLTPGDIGLQFTHMIWKLTTS